MTCPVMEWRHPTRWLSATAQQRSDFDARQQWRCDGIDACSNVTWSNDFDALSDDCGATGMTK